jgi:hypothetical protein
VTRERAVATAASCAPKARTWLERLLGVMPPEGWNSRSPCLFGMAGMHPLSPSSLRIRHRGARDFGPESITFDTRCGAQPCSSRYRVAAQPPGPSPGRRREPGARRAGASSPGPSDNDHCDLPSAIRSWRASASPVPLGARLCVIHVGPQRLSPFPGDDVGPVPSPRPTIWTFPSTASRSRVGGPGVARTFSPVVRTIGAARRAAVMVRLAIGVDHVDVRRQMENRP